MSDYYHEIDLSYKIPFGSVQDIYVDVVDGNGLCYRVTVDHIALDEEGTYIEDDQHWSNNDVIVYDKQGTELYRGIW